VQLDPMIKKNRHIINISHYAISIVLILNFSKVFSQADYQPGFIVSLNGDTLHGLIDVRSEVRNSRLVNFMESVYADKTTFYPGKISSYNVNEESFYSKKAIEKEEEKSVFMLLKMGGKISFYSYRDMNGKERNYVEKGNEFVELTNDLKEFVKKDPVTGTDKTYTSNSNKYYAVLKYLFSDCVYYQKNELKVDFNASSIAKEVSRYNACFGTIPTVEAEIKKKKGVFKKSILIGINFAHVVTSARNRYFNSEEQGLNGLSIGFLGQLYPANFNKKIGLDFGIFYNKKGDISERPNGEFNLHYLDFFAGLDFNYPKWKLQPSISAGFVYGFLLNPGSAYTKVNEDNEKENIFNNDIGNDEFGYLIAFSLNYYLNEKHAISFRVSYESTQLNFQFIEFSFKNKMTSIRIGYLF